MPDPVDNPAGVIWGSVPWYVKPFVTQDQIASGFGQSGLTLCTDASCAMDPASVYNYVYSSVPADKQSQVAQGQSVLQSVVSDLGKRGFYFSSATVGAPAPAAPVAPMASVTSTVNNVATQITQAFSSPPPVPSRAQQSLIIQNAAAKKRPPVSRKSRGPSTLVLFAAGSAVLMLAIVAIAASGD